MQSKLELVGETIVKALKAIGDFIWVGVMLFYWWIADALSFIIPSSEVPSYLLPILQVTLWVVVIGVAIAKLRKYWKQGSKIDEGDN
jgi:hypothetical protein